MCTEFVNRQMFAYTFTMANFRGDTVSVLCSQPVPLLQSGWKCFSYCTHIKFWIWCFPLTNSGIQSIQMYDNIHVRSLFRWELYPFVETCVFQVEELYDAYCIQRRLRDGASKMVAAFNSATGSKEARESLSEANKGYRECTEASDWPEGVALTLY